MRFLFVFILLLLSILWGCGFELPEKMAMPTNQPPNIIWLVAEDQSPDWFPMYGNNTLAMPNLTALANDGVVFDNAVSPVPVCAPARSSIITGMYPTTLGTHNMRTYNGYGQGTNQPTINVPSYSPIVPEGVKMFSEYLREHGYYTANGPKEDYNFEKTDAAWNESGNGTHWRKRKNGQPFFTVFNFSVCHESQIWQRGGDSLFVDPQKVPIPPYFPDNEIIRHDLAVNYSNLKRLDDQIGRVLAELKEDGLYENSIIFFYGDHGGPFPRYKRALYDTGVKVPMVIKFAKNLNAGTRDDRLFSFIDLAPTVLSMAGIEPPKVIQGKALFGPYRAIKNADYTFHSSDRFDERYDRLRAVRSKRFKYIKSYDTTISHAMPVAYREQIPMMRELRQLYDQRSLDQNQSLWLHPTKPSEELYDLNQDPYELNNLAASSEHRDTLAHMRDVLEHWMEDTHDLGRIPEQELIAKWLPSGKQPQLSPLQIMEKEGKIHVLSTKSDATILWKTPQDSVWTIYTEPLPSASSFLAKAQRIGFMESEPIVYNLH